MKTYPALDVEQADGEVLLAVVDDYSPTALEEHNGIHTVFFADAAARDQAVRAVARALPGASLRTREVEDQDWTRRSQENLGPVTVGRITVTPPWSCQLFSSAAGGPPRSRPYALRPRSGRGERQSNHDVAAIPGGSGPQPFLTADPGQLTIVIQPSMGFGTGHHATTRLCLAALQKLKPGDVSVLDVGTGSGVLALAARALWAREALGIDNDPDAIACARDNLRLNSTDHVRFELGDLLAPDLGQGREPREYDVVIANLTAVLVSNAAAALVSLVRAGGALVLSGLLLEDRPDVLRALGRLELVWEADQDDWAVLVLRKAVASIGPGNKR